ncbi:MAG: dockerin type I repeat-containing protein [Clostridia bacterium]|nr:dockerin type I repeat-containing protein [Clostridia bacterium]
MKNSKFLKVFSAFLAVCMTVMLCVTPAVAASVWDGVSASDGLSGAGTAADPYLIKTADDFAYFASESRGGNSYTGQYIELDEDISLDNVSISPLGGFNGTFDGKGHEISGISITSSSGNAGFFTGISSGTVRNLTLTGSLTSTGSAIGGFAGYVSSATFINCVNNMNVTGSSKVGGLCGTVNNGANVKVISCTNNGTITATNTTGYSFLGGLIGEIQKASSTSYGTVTILYSQNTGTVVSQTRNLLGGLVGQNRGALTVSNCINSGTVTGLTMIGGIVANVNNDAISLTIKNTINVGTLRTTRTTGATAHIGGILGYYHEKANSETFENAFYRDSDCVFNGANDGQTSDTPRGTAKNTASEWTDGTITALLGSAFEQGASYPELVSTTLPGSGSQSDPYLISNMFHLTLFSLLTKNSVNFNGDIVNLTADIEIDDNSILPLENFQGLFDGKGYEVSGINISSSSDSVGFFSSITGGGSVRNLTLDGSITSTGSGVGGFAGYVSTANFLNCVNNIDVTGLRMTGGFCGQVSNNGTANFTHCINNGNVTATVTTAVYSNNGGFIGSINTGSTANISLSENTGYVYSPVRNVVGGFVAQTLGTLTVKNCINSGKVEGLSMMGGIVADVSGATAITVRNTINVGEIKTIRGAGQEASIGGILGYYTGAANSETFENAYYRDSDNNFNGASDQQPSATPRGTAMNTATDWTDGTVAELLGSVFEQGDYYPVFAHPHLSGNGKVDSPYLITSADDFQDVNALVRGGNRLEDLYFKLVNDIILNEDYEDYEDWGTTAPTNNWSPIGTNASQFAGNLDGAGHTIYGLYCSYPDSDTGTGFFGGTYRGTINDIHIKNSYVSALHRVGGMSGFAQESTYIGCSFEGIVTSANTSNYSGSAGGLIGNAGMGNKLERCMTAGTIDSYSRSAGLIGSANATGKNYIYDCYSTMNVTGLGTQEAPGSGTAGLVGLVQNGTVVIDSCFFAGTYPSGSSTRGPIAGHVVGTVEDTNCWYLADEADGIYGDLCDEDEFADGTVLDLIQGTRDETVWIQGETTPIFAIKGDLNFDTVIDLADAMLLLRHIQSVSALSSSEVSLADLDADGSVTMTDYNAVKVLALNAIIVEEEAVVLSVWSNFG